MRIGVLKGIALESIDFEAPTRDMVKFGLLIGERNAQRKAAGQALRRGAGDIRRGDEWWGDDQSFGLEMLGI